jgi:hypothetical protein
MTDKAEKGSESNQTTPDQITANQSTTNTTSPPSPQQPQGAAQTQGGGQPPQIPTQTVQNLPELSEEDLSSLLCQPNTFLALTGQSQPNSVFGGQPQSQVPSPNVNSILGMPSVG